MSQPKHRNEEFKLVGSGHVDYAAENLEEERGNSSFHRVGFVEEGGGNLSDDDTYSGWQKITAL